MNVRLPALAASLALAISALLPASATAAQSEFVFGPAPATGHPVLVGSYLRHEPAVEREAWLRLGAQPRLPLWHRQFSYKGKAYSYEMVGTDPAKGSVTTTVPVYIVPLDFVFANHVTLDARAKGQYYPLPAVPAFERSPFFNAVDFKSGPTDVGTTQFIDAFQRANFWQNVSRKSPDYHMLLAAPTVLPALKINVSASQGSTSTTSGGIVYGTVDGNLADTAARAYMTKMHTIAPSGFAIFLSYNTIIGSGVSFHSSVGPQTYTITMFNDPGVLTFLGQQFASVANIEVSTHEVGEWTDDPFGNNITPGFGILEVGDALDGNRFFAQLGKITYNMQELAFHDWFLCDASTSANGWYSYLDTLQPPAPGC